MSNPVEEYIAKLVPCEPPCDSWGICDNCYEATLIRAGAELERKRSQKLVDALINSKNACSISCACRDRVSDIVLDALTEYDKPPKESTDEKEINNGNTE